MSYFCFFSYARKNFDHYMKQFYNDLINELELLNGGSYEKICFRDTRSINTGEWWEESLARGIATSRILISMLSPSYFESEWCGKEWQIFNKRINEYKKEHSISEHPPLIFPVLWAPKCSSIDKAPSCVTKLQFSHDSFGKIYTEEGLLQLMKVNRYKDEYHIFLGEFAKRIVEMTEKYKLPSYSKNIQSIKNIKNAFHTSPTCAKIQKQKTSTRYVKFVYAVARIDEIHNLKEDTGAYGTEGGLEWKPYFPRHKEDKDEIGIIAQSVAVDENFHSEKLPVNNELCTKICESQYNNIVIIFVDPWTLKLLHYQKIMKKYDKLRSYNCAVLVPFNDYDQETKVNHNELKEQVQKVFLCNIIEKNTDSFRNEISSKKELCEQLSDAFQKIRARIIRSSQNFRRVADEDFINKPSI
ncbi:putative TIR domain-containing protein [Candidatus Magnetomoraceae bacterium gMMP-15]